VGAFRCGLRESRALRRCRLPRPTFIPTIPR
jgi:hypothetical protein